MKMCKHVKQTQFWRKEMYTLLLWLLYTFCLGLHKEIVKYVVYISQIWIQLILDTTK